MRVIVASCSVTYEGRGKTTLDEAVRLLLVKRDGTVLVISDDSSSRPLNWLTTPIRFEIEPLKKNKKNPDHQRWTVSSKSETLTIDIVQIFSDYQQNLEETEPGLNRSWTEPHLQAWLAGHVEEVFGSGWQLVSREYPTGAGPVDLFLLDARGRPVAVEVKRRATMNAIDQVGRYTESLKLEKEWSDVRGIVIALDVRPRARELAQSRGVEWIEISAEHYRKEK
jgi:RecB family endonuclease NucS